jgi:hypothetical protein
MPVLRKLVLGLALVALLAVALLFGWGEYRKMNPPAGENVATPARKE